MKSTASWKAGSPGSSLGAEYGVDIESLSEEGVPVERDALHSGRQSEEGYASEGFDKLHGLVHCVHAADGFYHEVGAFAVGEVEDGVGGALSG